MDKVQAMEFAHSGVYIALGVVAFWGVTASILYYRMMGRRQFPSREASENFTQTLGQHIAAGDFEEAEQWSAAPETWYKALPTLCRAALQKRALPPTKLQQFVLGRFETDILGPLDAHVSSIETCIKSGPLLGLLGTVVAMIGAFGKIAGTEKLEPSDLADEISLALQCTAIGLSIAISMIMALTFLTGRRRRFEDATLADMQEVLEDLDRSAKRSATRGRQRAGV